MHTSQGDVKIAPTPKEKSKGEDKLTVRDLSLNTDTCCQSQGPWHSQ